PYGRDINGTLGTAWLRLLNSWSDSEDASRKKLVYALLAQAADTAGVATTGIPGKEIRFGETGGGIGDGRWSTLLFGAVLTNNENWRQLAGDKSPHELSGVNGNYAGGTIAHGRWKEINCAAVLDAFMYTKGYNGVPYVNGGSGVAHAYPIVFPSANVKVAYQGVLRSPVVFTDGR